MFYKTFNLIKSTGVLAKKQLFCKLWFEGLGCSGLQMCCFVGGVSTFFERVEKKQNKFPSNCTALSTEYQSNQSVFCNYFNFLLSYQCVELVLHTCLQRCCNETFVHVIFSICVTKVVISNKIVL